MRTDCCQGGKRDIALLYWYCRDAAIVDAKKLNKVEQIVNRDYSDDRNDLHRYLQYMIRRLTRGDLDDNDY